MLIFHFATLPSGAKMMWQVEHAKDASQAPSKSTWPEKKPRNFQQKWVPKILQPGSGVQLPKRWSLKAPTPGAESFRALGVLNHVESHPNKETDHRVNGDTFARLFLRAQVKFKHFDMFQVSAIHHDTTPTPPTPFASNGLGTVFREPSLNLKWKPQLWGRKSWNFHPKTTPWNASLVIQICPEVLADLFCIFIHNCRWKMMVG